ncbi:MAG: hypothetical protein JWM48_229 [Mycobacterium sp.]|jgi:uncharacterized repeat protein (TIGR03847 family)|nr:hypothetical protein [Mycobacterium sp.]MCW2743679.1 hypothetical protein [Mycobacterium sp.]
MTRELFVFEQPERFVPGTVGQPGERAFFLQAVDRGRSVTVALEKSQVDLLGRRMASLLDEVERRTDLPASRAGAVDLAPLEVPFDQEFRVGTLTLAWDSAGSRVVVEAQAVVETGEPAPPLSDDDGPPTLRVYLSPAAGRAFAARASRLVDAGRQPCPLCGLPLDPAGHLCPRLNGHRVPA